MFKRQPKHVFTCPDVIHLQQKAKHQKKVTTVILLSSMAALWTLGYFAEKNAPALELDVPDTETPTES